MEPNAELRSYLESVRRLTGALSATLYIPSGSSPATAALLLHVGDASPVPELRSMEAASRFHQRQPVRTGGADGVVRRRDSSAANAVLLHLCLGGFQSWVDGRLGVPDVEERRQRDTPDLLDNSLGTVWIGLVLRAGGADTEADPESTLVRDASRTLAKGLASTLIVGARLAWSLYQTSTLLRDRVTSLPGRAELQAQLGRTLDHGLKVRRPMGLLLLSPDDFVAVNHRLGRENGDRILGEISKRLRACLRRSDLPFRYGGAVFAILLPDSGSDAARHVAEKLRAAVTAESYLDHAMPLTFSIGGVTVEPASDEHLEEAHELMRLADAALHQAKLAGGGRSLFWQGGGDPTRIGSIDRLSGIFTADPEKDYRHMLLLWDTVNVISTEADSTAIAAAFTQRVCEVFRPLHVALLGAGQSHSIGLLAEVLKDTRLAFDRGEAGSISLSRRQQELFEHARKARKPGHARLRIGAERRGEVVDCGTYVLPLSARERFVGWLYLAGAGDGFELDSSGLLFLSALGNQIGTALDHARLADEAKREQDRERIQLKSEVRSLRRVLMQAKLVYASRAMHDLVERLRRVAPTDATVLIIGESGTGKEMLARAVHDMSDRRERPMVTVDCGAIPENLLESELFGRVKGAFTGADKAVSGRVAEADGGTLLLDEIGELPLPLQAKMLRFVQEKEVTPVGAVRTRKVDVRILAATNRDLAREVEMGRFRQDLYYRLKVFEVEAIPLRRRPDDIPPLVECFLERFADQYGRSQLGLTTSAVEVLSAYHWPGNVRELQNTILKAVVMARQGQKIDAAHLDLPSSARRPSEPRPAASAPRPAPARAKAEDRPLSDDAIHWALLEQVKLALAVDGDEPPPLGRWLNGDLLLLADARSGGVVRKAAAALGMAETSCRRQLAAARQPGAGERPARWVAMAPVVRGLLTQGPGSAGGSLPARARQLLLDVVSTHLADDDPKAAALMGVTTPTYRRWRERLKDCPPRT